MSRAPRPSRARKLLFSRYTLIAAVVIALLAGLWYWRTHQADAAEGAYRTAAVEQGDIRVAISSTGTLSATSTVTVGSQVSGQISEVYVDFNSPVKKGQVLAKIDVSNYQAQLAQGQAQIANARASLRNAELDYQRKAELGRQKLVAQGDVDLARAALDQARAQLAQMSAGTQNTQVNIDRAIIRSPVDGVVLTRKIERGQTVQASMNAPELFTIAEDLAKMKIELAVDEADIGQVKTGQTVSFTADAFPDRKFKGVVEQVRLAATTTNNVVTYPVVVTVDNGDGTLLPGLTVNAEIEVSQRDGVLKVSNAALRYKPASNDAPPAMLSGQQRPQSSQNGPRGGGITDDLARAVAAMKVDANQQAAFDAAVAAVKQRQQARQRQSQGGGFGGPGMVMMVGGSNAANMQAQMRQRMAERFKQDFAAFRETLDDAQKKQWDAALSALVNAKRATLYKLVDGEPQPVMVRLGASDGTDTEVSGGGLKAGDLIVTGERAKAKE